MDWEEVKKTPRHELKGLIIALSEYNILHSFDGYSRGQIAELQKEDPAIAQHYADYVGRQRKFNYQKSQAKSFSELL